MALRRPELYGWCPGLGPRRFVVAPGRSLSHSHGAPLFPDICTFVSLDGIVHYGKLPYTPLLLYEARCRSSAESCYEYENSSSATDAHRS